MAEVLVCKNVSVRYEPDMPPTLSGISFLLDEGQRVALVGLNGTGKTTLLMALAGLVPHDGEISICGTRLTRRTVAQIRGDVGFLFNVPEDQLLFPKAVEDVAFGLVRRGCETGEAFQRARCALDDLGVGHLAEVPLHHLSHGQKQRVALAGSLVTNPRLLLLDEPSAGLDPVGKRELADILGALGSTQLIATHDLDFADRLCARILLLEKGTIAAEQKDTAALRQSWQLG